MAGKRRSAGCVMLNPGLLLLDFGTALNVASATSVVIFAYRNRYSTYTTR